MFNSIGNIISELKHENSETWQQTTTKIIEGTLLASVCAYGGTYFFTRYPPRIGASYFGIVVLVSQVVYRALEELKKSINLSCYRNVIVAGQLLQIPFFFYLFHGSQGQMLSAATKMEIITATAHFAAIPIFIHLGTIAWNEPTVEHIAAAMGVMLPLASRLQLYAELFKS